VCFCFFYRSQRCALIAGALINILNGASIAILQVLGARKLLFSEFEMCLRNTDDFGILKWFTSAV
jgi:hypothetical protein